MAGNIVPTPLNVLADELRAAFDRRDQRRDEWIEATIDLAIVLRNARQRFDSDRAFGHWLLDNDLNRLSDNDRAALISMAADPELFREILTGQTDQLAPQNRFGALGKAAKYLLAGNGVGFLISLSTLSGIYDRYVRTPPRLRVTGLLETFGLLAAIFGVGLLLGAIYFGVLTLLKVEAPQRIIANEWPTGVRGKVSEVIGLVALWGSAAALALGVGWIIVENLV
jgi:hypothetical protein